MISQIVSKKQLRNIQFKMMSNDLKNIAIYKTYSKTENLENIRDFVFKNSIKFGFNSYKAEELVLAVDEACTNLIKHAYKYNLTDNITIELKCCEYKFIVKIIDNSQPFDPREVTDPDLEQYRKEYRKGGLGIFIMKSLVDNIDYTTSQNGKIKNILTLTKHLV